MDSSIKLSCFICCIAILFMFAGCGVKTEDLAKNSLSEIHNNYFVGQTQNFNISLWSGQREEPYVIDGKKENLVDFCVISVVPKTNVSTFGLSYTVEINEETYNGEFENSPFDSSMASDLKIKVCDTDTIFLYLIANGETEIGKLECISCSFGIKQTDAINKAIEHLKDKIVDLSDNGKKNIEGTCKIISTDKNLGVYFWFINFINSDGEQIAVVLDINNGEIITEK